MDAIFCRGDGWAEIEKMADEYLEDERKDRIRHEYGLYGRIEALVGRNADRAVRLIKDVVGFAKLVELCYTMSQDEYHKFPAIYFFVTVQKFYREHILVTYNLLLEIEISPKAEAWQFFLYSRD